VVDVAELEHERATDAALGEVRVDLRGLATLEPAPAVDL
jgi:hypothetical protein